MADQAPTNPDATKAEAASAAPTASSASAQAAEALQTASRAVDAIAAEALQGDGTAKLDLPDFGRGVNGRAASPADLDLLGEVNLHVKVELGRTRMYVEDVLRLSPDSIVELDKLAGDPVDIYVNDHHVARGEVLVVNDNFCVRVSEIIQKVGR
jgi:flagellar motor switch protein FliN/FliY